MTNSDWWWCVKTPPLPETIPVRPREHVCTLRKDQHEATLETRGVQGVGQELIFSVNGHWRRMRVFTQRDPAGVAASTTIGNLEALGWERLDNLDVQTRPGPFKNPA